MTSQIPTTTLRLRVGDEKVISGGEVGMFHVADDASVIVERKPRRHHDLVVTGYSEGTSTIELTRADGLRSNVVVTVERGIVGCETVDLKTQALFETPLPGIGDFRLAVRGDSLSVLGEFSILAVGANHRGQALLQIFGEHSRCYRLVVHDEVATCGTKVSLNVGEQRKVALQSSATSFYQFNAKVAKITGTLAKSPVLDVLGVQDGRMTLWMRPKDDASGCVAIRVDGANGARARTAAPPPHDAPREPGVITQSTLRLNVGEFATLPFAELGGFFSSEEEPHALVDRAMGSENAITVTGYSAGTSTFDVMSKDGARERLTVTVDEHGPTCRPLAVNRQGLVLLSIKDVSVYNHGGRDTLAVLPAADGSTIVLSGVRRGKAFLRTVNRSKTEQCFRISVSDDLVSCETRASLVIGAPKEIPLEDVELLYYAAGEELFRPLTTRMKPSSTRKGMNTLAGITYVGQAEGRATIWTLRDKSLETHCIAVSIVEKP